MMIRLECHDNTLALKIPQKICASLRLTEGSPMKITADGNRLVIESAFAPSLEEMLAQVTPENIHKEIQM